MERAGPEFMEFRGLLDPKLDVPDYLVILLEGHPRHTIFGE